MPSYLKGFVVILIVSIFISFTLTACDFLGQNSTPSSEVSDVPSGSDLENTPTPIESNSPQPEVKRNLPTDEVTKGKIYQFGPYGWGNYYGTERDAHYDKIELKWVIADITDDYFLLVLNNDFEEILDVVPEGALSYNSPELLNWLNNKFFYETFYPGWSHLWARILEETIETSEGNKACRVFLLSQEEIDTYLGSGVASNSYLRPAIKISIDENIAIDDRKIWDIYRDHFLYRLMKKDVKRIIEMIGAAPDMYSRKDVKWEDLILQYDFLTKANIEDIKVVSQKKLDYGGFIYEIDIKVNESETDYFKVGENLWMLETQLSEGGVYTYFRPQNNPVNSITWDNEASNNFAYRFIDHLYPLADKYFNENNTNIITDFNLLLPTSTADERFNYESFLATTFRFFEFYNEFQTNSIKISTFQVSLQNAFGISGLDLTRHSDYIEQSDEIEILGMGGIWYYVGLDFESFDSNSKIHTVDVSVYGDTIYLVPSVKLQFKIRENEDGTYKFVSVEKTYDSGIFPISGSI